MTATMFDINTVPEEHRERVASLIPDPRLADVYVHRQLGQFEDFDLLDVAVDERENILLAGPTGSSKTTVFRAYAAARAFPFALVECNAAMDPGVVLGRTTLTADGEAKFVYGDMALVHAFGGVVLYDEINMAHPRITAAYHQQLAVTRRLSIPEAGVTFAAGREGLGEQQPTLFGAAYNPRYQGTVRLNEALSNRFGMQLDWDYDHAVEAQLLTSTSLLEMAENARSLAEIRTPVSTNALMEFERHAERFGVKFAITLFVNRFAAEERGPVFRAIDAHSARIAQELEVSL